jgi:NAD(P)-dependent dehydrogenase (short-subunit alcohol dehydrogenase family)
MSDRVVLITGGASGIGRAAALAFAADGARVVIGDLAEERAQETAERVRATGGRATAQRCDVTRPEDLERLVAAAQAAGDLQAVFGNAGLLRTASLDALTREEFERHLAVNLTANLWLAKLAAPVLRARGGGALVFTASLGGLRGSAGSMSYNAAKGGLVNLARSLADELAPAVRVNCLCPGWIDTPFNDPFWDHASRAERERVLASIPLGRQGTPEDVAPAAVFLAGDGARYITGQTLIIDGGLMAT